MILPFSDSEYNELMNFFGSERNIINFINRTLFNVSVMDVIKPPKKVEYVEPKSFDDDTTYPEPLTFLDFLLDIYTINIYTYIDSISNNIYIIQRKVGGRYGRYRALKRTESLVDC